MFRVKNIRDLYFIAHFSITQNLKPFLIFSYSSTSLFKPIAYSATVTIVGTDVVHVVTIVIVNLF